MQWIDVNRFIWLFMCVCVLVIYNKKELFAATVHLKCAEEQQKPASSVGAAPGRLFEGFGPLRLDQRTSLFVCFYLGGAPEGYSPPPPRHSAIPSPGFTLGAQSTGAPLTSPSPRPTPWWPRRPEFDQRKNTGRLPTEPNQNQGPCRGAGSAPPRLTSPTMTLIRDISPMFPCV